MTPFFSVYSEKKGGLPNPPPKGSADSKKHPKASKIFKKRIKNPTEPFEGSGLYQTAEPSLAKPFFAVRNLKKGFAREGSTVW
jgi:hypothetical protein